MVRIDNNNPLPYYQQIFQQIATAIDAGDIDAGTRLPSVRALANRLNVSRNTVNQAYIRLARAEYVTGKRGSGYVVNGKAR